VSAELKPSAKGATVVQMDPGVFFDERRRLITARIADVVRHAGHLETGTDGRIWRYEGGVYKPDGDRWARARVREMLGDECRRTSFEEVITWLRSFEPTVTDRPDTSYVNVANGILDLATLTIRSHSPETISTVQLPVAWRPEATCPRVDGFLKDILPEDAVDFVLEMIGYALYADNPFHKSILLTGPGGNGKSKLLALVRALLGPINVSAVPLQAFGENRFAAAEAFGRLANICGDLDARAIRRTDLFKQLTGGDPIMAERKFAHPFNYTSFALPIFSANEVPLTSDQTDAWFQRWLVIPMDRVIRGTPFEDPNIEKKILRSDELEGLLVRAVHGLRSLLARGHFDVPGSVAKANDSYRDRLDSVRGFVVDCCVLLDDAWVPRPALYRHYRGWCNDNGREAPNSAVFYERLQRDYRTIVIAGRKGQRGFRGIGLVAAEEAES
jgi:putative DNA primase/helicase